MSPDATVPRYSSFESASPKGVISWKSSAWSLRATSISASTSARKRWCSMSRIWSTSSPSRLTVLGAFPPPPQALGIKTASTASSPSPRACPTILWTFMCYSLFATLAKRPGGVEQQMPGDPAQERGDARYREAQPRAGPRPGGEDGGGEHPGHDSVCVSHRCAVHERSSIPQFERLGGTEYPARFVLGPHRNVGLIRLERYGSLEALARRRSHGLQLVRSGAGEYLPGGGLRGAVPADVERYFAFGSYFSDDGGRLFGVPLPRKAEGPVGL